MLNNFKLNDLVDNVLNNPNNQDSNEYFFKNYNIIQKYSDLYYQAEMKAEKLIDSLVICSPIFLNLNDTNIIKNDIYNHNFNMVSCKNEISNFFNKTETELLNYLSNFIQFPKLKKYDNINNSISIYLENNKEMFSFHNSRENSIKKLENYDILKIR